MQEAQHLPTSELLLWDIFCRVIDNFGDLGVCWRLSADLARHGHTVRLWVDDASALRWMAPGALENQWPRVSVMPWDQTQDALSLAKLVPGDVWVEGFGCEIAPEFIVASAQSTRNLGSHSPNFPVWINLEYLSAEAYVERAHALPSPVMHGPATGQTKYFFYPGFTNGTGGLLRGPGLNDDQLRCNTTAVKRNWLDQQGVNWNGEFLVSLFCYEPAGLGALMRQWATQLGNTRLLVAAGRTAQAVRAALVELNTKGDGDSLQISYLPHLSQIEFDRLLWCCDLNFVRGEDSLVRAIWAGKPLVWHIYPQDDDAHQAKLQAFLNLLNAPRTMVQFHREWNGIDPAPPEGKDAVGLPTDLSTWQGVVRGLRAQLLQTADLTTQLIGFVQKKR